MAEQEGGAESSAMNDTLVDTQQGSSDQQFRTHVALTLGVVSQPCCLVLVGTACVTLVFGCWRAWVYHIASNDEEDEDGQYPSLSLTHRHAMWIPVLSSCALLAMFFLFSYIQYILLLSVLFSAVYSLNFSTYPFFFTSVVHVRVAVMGVLVLSWLYTGHWILNNMIAAAMCITFLSHVRLPNFKICATLLGALFFYDIFWVFFSSHIFGSNVMTEAADKRADNVAVRLAEKVAGKTFDSLARRIDLPTKFKVPADLFLSGQQESPDQFIMLGAGDVAMPGLLLVLGMMADMAYSLQYTHKKSLRPRELAACILPMGLSRQRARGKPTHHMYTTIGLIGYLVGLFSALVSSIFFQVAQPALLYLVPSTLIPMYVQGVRNGDDWQANDPAAAGTIIKDAVSQVDHV